MAVELRLALEAAEYDMAHTLSCTSLYVISWVSCMTELSKVDTRLSVYIMAVIFLHVAYKIGRSGFNEKLVKDLTVATSKFVDLANEQTLLLLNKFLTWVHEYEQSAVNSTNYSIPELIELLQQSSVELMTTYRQLQAQDLYPVVTIVTTDFQMMYAYKHGDYLRCLQLSTQNVFVLVNSSRVYRVPAFPEFLQFLDDDIVSLTALIMIVNPKCRECNNYASITQLTLSLYLMSHCQLKLRQSPKLLAQTLDYIEVAQSVHDVRLTLDHLTLKIIERELITYITCTTT